jgi:putative restriction endonuclease
VEHKDAHSPGTGFVAWDMDDLERGRAEVYSFPWDRLDNPFRYAADGSTEADLVRLLAKNPGSASDVFARVKVRGMVQIIFRKLLLTTYRSRCAFCGLTFAHALEAAHLIPWTTASQEQRLDPRNGLLLCSTHHRLFDAGILTITKAGTIKYCDPDLEDGPYSPADKLIVVLDGKTAWLPDSKLHQPADWAIERHHKAHGWPGLT